MYNVSLYFNCTLMIAIVRTRFILINQTKGVMNEKRDETMEIQSTSLIIYSLIIPIQGHASIQDKQ